MASEGDLVHDAWLTAVTRDGDRQPVGLLSALRESHTVRRIELPVHTMLPVVLRQLLLPVVIDVLGAPRTRQEWAERFHRGRFSQDEQDRLADYLNARYGDRFRLFDAERPFAQVTGLQALNGGDEDGRSAGAVHGIRQQRAPVQRAQRGRRAATDTGGRCAVAAARALLGYGVDQDRCRGGPAG
ncbi:hypothetical protein STENM327S_06144 [Streptomyces tendae]